MIALAGCQSPYKKKDEDETKPLRDVSKDTSFQAFLGRLRIAVVKRDLPMLASMMTSDFGYRGDAAPPGETVFTYWDQNNVWPELTAVLREKFAANDNYMVAPAQAIGNADYKGYLAGMRISGGSWKFAYFIAAEALQ